MEAGAASLGPALPAIVEPPVVMVGQQREVVLFASVGEFLRQDEIPRQTQIVCPDQGAAGLRQGEELFERTLDSPTEFRGRRPLFGSVTEGVLHKPFHRRATAGSFKIPAPFPVGPL